MGRQMFYNKRLTTIGAKAGHTNKQYGKKPSIAQTRLHNNTQRSINNRKNRSYYWNHPGRVVRRAMAIPPPQSKAMRVLTRNVERNLTADNSWLGTYKDRINTTSVGGTPASQIMWGTNQSSSTNGQNTVAQYQLNNLQMYDPFWLKQLAGSVQSGNTSKFEIKEYQVDCEIANINSSPVYLWEYRCRARRDQQLATNGIDTIIQNGFADANNYSGGMTGAAFNTGPVNSSVFGATPFMNPRLVFQHKIVKVRKWLLKPGQTKRITYKSRKLRMFNEEQLSMNSNLLDQLKGTSCSVFVAQPTWAFNSTQQVSGTSGVGVGDVSLGILHRIKFHYSYVQDATTNTNYWTAVGNCGQTGPVYAIQPCILAIPPGYTGTNGPIGYPDVPLTISGTG